MADQIKIAAKKEMEVARERATIAAEELRNIQSEMNLKSSSTAANTIKVTALSTAALFFVLY